MAQTKIEWAVVPGWPDLQVSRCGKLKGPSGKILKLQVSSDGYYYVTFRRRKLRVHRAVLRAFIGPPPEGCETRHLDGNECNNRVENLAWGTRHEQRRDDEAHGVRRTHGQRLSMAQARSIRVAPNSSRMLGAQYGVSHATILAIKQGRRYHEHED